jgi:membrane protein YqaA with SNARE-associated domain
VNVFPPVFDQMWFFFGYLFVDALALPLASTVYVAYAGTKNPPALVALVGALGTTLGSLGQYQIVRWIVTRPSGLPGWLVRLRDRIEGLVGGSSHATFWALFVIYATPLGAGPLRLVAAAGRYSRWKFLLAIFLGCLPYYFALAWFGHSVRLPAWVYACAIVAVFALGIAQLMARRAQRRHPDSAP